MERNIIARQAEPESTAAVQDPSSRKERYRQAAPLLRSWMAEGDPKSTKFWPLLQEELRNDPVAVRE